jgi:glycosyltransferase involved in cell wall biosynthesis
MPSFYRSLDAFVLSSKDCEGLPLVILEALAAGCPVVSTNVAGAGEVITDGVTGLLVESGDVTGMAIAMRRIAHDPILARRIGHAGRDRVLNHFTVERVARDVMQLYRAELECATRRSL